MGFDQAHAFVAKWEGGLSDHPSDRGGVTAYGASLAFVSGLAGTREGKRLLASLGIQPPITRATIMALTPDKAKAMFRHEFWDKPRIGELEEPLAFCLYDCAVNMGAATSIRLCQQAANSLGQSLACDGIIGPLSRKAFADLGPALCRAHISLRRLRYQSLAKAPGQSAFLKGWLNRIDDLAKNLATAYGV